MIRDYNTDSFGDLGREAARLLPHWISPLVSRVRRQRDIALGRSSALSVHLARLGSLAAVEAAVSQRIEEEVYAAGRAGAGFTEIADALHTSRQNARHRWPEAVHHPPGPIPGRPGQRGLA